jgi:hypothetical protein
VNGVRHVVIAAERVQRWVDGFADRHGAISPEREADTLLITGADGARAWLSTPSFPGPIEFGPGAVTSFVLHARRERRVGVLLVRKGGYAAGVFQGARLLTSKVGSSYVQGTTKAGGWSQQRYARRRANQTAAAFGVAADVAAKILLPEASTFEALVRGGDTAAVQAVLADPRLAPLAVLPTGPVLDVPDPRLKVLQATPERFRTVRIDLDP